jgi:hypothetical protein
VVGERSKLKTVRTGTPPPPLMGANQFQGPLVVSPENQDKSPIEFSLV